MQDQNDKKTETTMRMTKHKKSGQIIRHKACDVIVLKHNILSVKFVFLVMYLSTFYNLILSNKVKVKGAENNCLKTKTKISSFQKEMLFNFNESKECVLRENHLKDAKL